MRSLRIALASAAVCAVTTVSFLGGQAAPAARLERAEQRLTATRERLVDAERMLGISTQKNERMEAELTSRQQALTQAEDDLKEQVKRVARLEAQLAEVTWIEPDPVPEDDMLIDVASLSIDCNATGAATVEATLHNLFLTQLDRSPRDDELETIASDVTNGMSHDCEAMGYMPDAQASAHVAFFETYSGEMDFRRRQAEAARSQQLLQESFDTARDMIMGN